ncbi:MAG: hypothetical protein ACI4MN_07345 [Candidatus Coproplasma sp.]
MNLSFLPADIQIALGTLNLNRLTEIRLKSGQPVIIHYHGEYKYLKQNGCCDDAENAIVCSSAQNVLERAMGNSVYTYAEQLKYGFITVEGGIRIGIGGEFVTQNGNVISVRGVTSLNIRIPHEAIGCSEEVFKVITTNGIKSTLIYSPPGYGKTTVVRDLARLISTKLNLKVLIADERNEISGVINGVESFNLGANCDFVRGASKRFVFENAVRCLSPQVIVTDEIYGKDDYSAIEFINECGLIAIATSHICDKHTLKSTKTDYFVELTGIAKKANIYDKDFNFICDCNTFSPVRCGAFGR